MPDYLAGCRLSRSANARTWYSRPHTRTSKPARGIINGLRFSGKECAVWPPAGTHLRVLSGAESAEFLQAGANALSRRARYLERAPQGRECTEMLQCLAKNPTLLHL